MIRRWDVPHSVEGLVTALEQARSRVVKLHEGDWDATQADLIGRAFEELETSFEELQVAHHELMQQQEELAVSRERVEVESARYFELFDFAPDAYLVTDPNGVILEANEAARQLFNVSRHVLHKPLVVYIAKEDRRQFHTLLGLLSKARETSEWVLRVRRRGQEEPVEVAARTRLVRDEDGAVSGIRWLLRDIAERRRLESENRAWSQELERRVVERTKELEEANRQKEAALDRERIARGEAETASHAKDDFLAMVSHELRTPLNSMSGWLYILRRELGSGEQGRQAASIIEANIGSLAQLIDDLVDVARIASGKLRLDIRPLDLVTVVEDALKVVEPAAAAKGIAIDNAVDQHGGRVAGDAERLKQVVSNLLMNAIKFSSRESGVEVRLERREDESPAYAQFTVRDSGSGITPELLPHVFERFRQGETDRVRGKGLGLGLAIVQHIVQMHGGTVHAESEGEGRGATFCVRLPLLRA